MFNIFQTTVNFFRGLQGFLKFLSKAGMISLEPGGTEVRVGRNCYKFDPIPDSLRHGGNNDEIAGIKAGKAERQENTGVWGSHAYLSRPSRLPSLSGACFP